jgi:GntR family transcriptional repressor for pyruvate dehydrogenase complex
MYTSNGSVRRQRPKVTDEIIEALRSEIVTGKLKVGDRLPTEKELAHNFGVSQPSVREAIRALEVMGLVEVRHGAGVFVTNDGIFGLTSAFLNLLQLENVGILEVQQLRRLFGIESAQLAAATVKPDQLSKIEAALQKIEEIDNISEVPEMYARLLDYQRAMSEAANNRIIYSFEIFFSVLMLELQSELFDTRSPEFWRHRILQLQVERAALRDAIASRSVEASRRVAEDYYGKMIAVFSRDKQMRGTKLSDPQLVSAISFMRDRFRMGSRV